MTLLSTLAQLIKPEPPPDPEVAAALDRVIGMVDPLVRAAPRLQKHLAGAVEHALAYCDGLVGALPGPIEINRMAFAQDPLVHALFATAGDIDEMLGRSQAVRDYLERPECWGSECFCAMLAARRNQKKQFGLAQQGDMIRADVPQEIVYFSDQTLIEPCSDPQQTRQRLRARSLESLLTTFNSHVNALRRERDHLRTDLKMEQVEVAIRHENHVQDEVLESHTRHIVELDFKLRQLSDSMMPEHLVEALADFLRQPESALSLNAVSLRVDRLGIVHTDGDDDSQIHTLNFPELSTRDRRLHLATLVRVSRAEAAEAVKRAKDRQHRYIII